MERKEPNVLLITHDQRRNGSTFITIVYSTKLTHSPTANHRAFQMKSKIIRMLSGTPASIDCNTSCSDFKKLTIHLLCGGL